MCSAGRPSLWALAHILVQYNLHDLSFCDRKPVLLIPKGYLLEQVFFFFFFGMHH